MTPRSTRERAGKGRVAVYFWEEYLGNAPSIINAVRVLSAAGYGVDVVTRYSPLFPPPPRFPANVRVFMQGGPSPGGEDMAPRAAERERWAGLAGVLRKRTPRVVRRLLRSAINRISPVSSRTGYETRKALRFFAFCRRATWNRHYTWVIGVDMLGLVIATVLHRDGKTPVVYWSLEIRYARELTHLLDRLLKMVERPCNRRAALTIIQDTERSNSLRVENAIDPAKIILVPNGPLGPRPQFRSDVLRRKFGLSRTTRIMLHIGQIDPAVMSYELAGAASQWPEDWVLVFHAYSKCYSERYIEQVREAGKGRALQSLEPVSYDDLDALVMSADIGIVAYNKDVSQNYALAGASGKLGHYLRCGLPVVCLELPGLPEVVHRWGCGICVGDIAGITGAVEQIVQRYEFYSSNAGRCYEEAYEFGRYFAQVLRHAEALTAASLAEEIPDRVRHTP